MYCTPWARLRKAITPNTSVSPAATRNSSTPSCSPLKHWTTNSEVDMGLAGWLPLPALARGEGRGEGRQHTPALEYAAAPHPGPLRMPEEAWGEGNTATSA